MKGSDLKAALAAFRPQTCRYARSYKGTKVGGEDDPLLGYGDCSAIAQAALKTADFMDEDSAKRQEWIIQNGLNENRAGMSTAMQSAIYRRVFHDVLPKVWAAEFFEEVNLANDEWPELELEEMETQFEVFTIGPDGAPAMNRKVGRETRLLGFLEFLRTDIVRYRLMDITLGNVAKTESIIKGLELSWEVKKHNMALTAINAAKLVSGMRSMPYMRLHPAIVAAGATANIPDKNYYDFSSGGLNLPNSGYITVEKMKRIFQHFDLLRGSTIDQEVPIKLKTLYISPLNKRDFSDMADLVGTFGATVAGITLDGTDITKPKDTLPTSVKEEIFKNGVLKHFYDNEFEIEMSNLIPAGYWYASTNLPLGSWFWKPGMKTTATRDAAEALRLNEGEIGFGTPQLLMIPYQWQYRCAFGKW